MGKERLELVQVQENHNLLKGKKQKEAAQVQLKEARQKALHPLRLSKNQSA